MRKWFLVLTIVPIVLISGCGQQFVGGGGGGMPEVSSSHTKILTADTAFYKRGIIYVQDYSTEIRNSDNSYAVVSHSSDIDYLEADFPNLDIPSDAQINNVVFEVEAKSDKWEESPGMDGEKDDFYINLGQTSYYMGDLDASNSQDAIWISKNAANVLNTRDKINDMNIWLLANPSGTGTSTYFDMIRIVIEYCHPVPCP